MQQTKMNSDGLYRALTENKRYATERDVLLRGARVKRLQSYSDRFLSKFYPGYWEGYVGFSGRYWNQGRNRFFTLFFVDYGVIDKGDFWVRGKWESQDTERPEIVKNVGDPFEASCKFLKLVGTDDPDWKNLMEGNQ